MKNAFKHVLAASAVVLVTACGGGGDDGGVGGSVDVVGGGGGQGASEPVTSASKYVGTYVSCDGDHTKYINTISDLGNGRLRFIPVEITYQNSNCTGRILATYSESQPTTASFLGSSTVAVSGPGFPSRVSMDRFSAEIPNMRASLAGPGVDGNCVNYPGGRFCYELNVVSERVEVGFQVSGNGFNAFLFEDGVYEYNDFYTKE